MSAVITAHHLSLRLGTTQALDEASISVDAGEIVAVLGPSGSGKSTLLHCLSGLLQPDSGQVSLRGERLDSLSEAQRSRLRLTTFGFVFQFGDLVPELTLLENVALPLQLNGVRRAAARTQSLDVMSELGIADHADSRLDQVSGGQQQRAAVARALVHEPAVIFADEPTGALDTASGEQVMDVLTRAARSRDAALILVTHDLRVASYADREVTMRDGKTDPALVMVP